MLTMIKRSQNKSSGRNAKTSTLLSSPPEDNLVKEKDSTLSQLRKKLRSLSQFLIAKQTRARAHHRPLGKENIMFKKVFYLAVALATAAALTACGGGGGSGPAESNSSAVTSPPAVNPPVVTLSVTTALSAPNTALTIQQGLGNAPVTFSWVATGSVTLKCGTATVATGATGPATFSAPLGTTSCQLFDGTNALGSAIVVTATCASGNEGSTGTCKAVAASAWWPPATITSTGVKVSGANQLPPGCNRAADQCWRDSVANGTVKFVATTATGANPRPIVFAFFRNTASAFGVTGLWNVLPFYADDGSLAASDISGGIASEVDWVSTNSNGAVMHDKTSGVCSELYYFASGSTWSTRPVTCPF